MTTPYLVLVLQLILHLPILKKISGHTIIEYDFFYLYIDFPDKRGGLWSEWFYKRGTIVLWFPPPNSDGINEILMKVALNTNEPNFRKGVQLFSY
jgi:hypothetical protein